MVRIGRYDNPYRSVEFDVDDEPPRGTTVEVLGIESEDHAYSHGLLWLPTGKLPRTVFALMHPRADFLRHYAVPGLLRAGYAVLTQNSRWIGNDSMLVHERVLLDVAAGVRRLRERGFEHVLLVGNSGGGSLYTFYVSQAHTSAGSRLTDTASGDPLDLNRFVMPRVDGMAYLAAHPGEGLFLLLAIDPSVTEDDDPVACDRSLDMYNPDNGFRPPPAESRYEPEFVERYRAAQRARVERIDDMARALVAERHAARRRARDDATDVDALRRAAAVRFLTVYRTEADPRYVDLRLDASARDYGSLFGHRPDVINYGPFGFGRLLTPEAWLSTWSGLSSRATIPRNGPAMDVPAIVISYTADNCVFPSDTQSIHDTIGSADKTLAEVAADHYGYPLPGAPTSGRPVAISALVEWARSHGW
jgi:hypothetical protein